MGDGFIVTHRGKSKGQLLGHGLQYASKKRLYSPGHADLRRLRAAQTAQTPEKGHFKVFFVRYIAIK